MVDYQKLYAYLVGQVDEVLQQIAEDLMQQKADWHAMNEVGEKLKRALLTAEEMYLNEE